MKCKQVSFILKVILTLNHSQKVMDSGFSINKNIRKSKMSAETVISKRIICDHMRSKQLQSHSISVS